MKDLLIIADSIVHVNFFGLVINVPSEYRDGYIALDAGDTFDVYAYMEPPVLNEGYVWQTSDSNISTHVMTLIHLIERIGLTEWPQAVGKQVYKISDLLI